MRRLPALLLALLAAAGLSGCFDLALARVPDRLLEGPGGNGWAKNLTASQREATEGAMGTAKTQTLVYEDRASAYAGSLTVTSARSLLTPSEASLRGEVETKVREQAGAKGLVLEGVATTGTRELANRATAHWFVHNGSVANQGFFARNAKVKVYGEVFHCPGARTVVVMVGLAQVTDTRTVGGIPVSTDTDLTTWIEIVGDPRGSIEGLRNSLGLAYSVTC